MKTLRPKDDQNAWNMAFSALFAVLLGCSIWYFYTVYRGVPQSMPLGDFLLISLAIFRITRLFVYDKITQFLRDAFLNAKEVVGEDGVIYIERTPHQGGPLRAMGDLLACPWCTGMWATLFVVFFYYTVPFAWYVIVLLAIAGVGNVIQLIANMIGWRAESLKLDVQGRGEGHIRPDGS